MTFTVKQLAKLSGVSVRTLHFYDEIGLLKPAYYGENKYRYYEEEQLLLLQQILFFRQMGFPLEDIKKIMSSDDFDKIETLISHKTVLEQQREQTAELLKTIDKTINYLKGKIKMRDEEFFESLRSRDSEKQKEYEKYLIDKGVMTEKDLDKSWENVKNWKKEDWKKIENQGDDLNKKLVNALHKNLDPGAEEVQKLVREHYNSIKIFWIPTKETYIGLGQLYLEHPDFKKYYDHYDSKLLEFLVKAMKIFAERELE